ncbi:MAG: hypothetical protein J1F06_00025 [Prevotellaceae bacterium]|nr:hypothetical protein [Prevotellaceae bacterium]
MKKLTYKTPCSRAFGFAAQSMLAASQLTSDGSQNSDITPGEGEWNGDFQSNHRAFDTDNFWRD